MTQQGLTGHAEAIGALARRWLEVSADGPDPARPGGDLVCSPAGLWLTLAALAAGARGGTAAELEGLLGTAGRPAAPAVTAVARALARTDALACGTAVWTREPVHTAYRDGLPCVGFGELEKLTGGRLDDWVREATGGRIGHLPLQPAAGTQLLLVNVLALTARWQTPFDPAGTAMRPFTDVAGTTAPVRTMRGPVPGADAWLVPGHGAAVVQLRCSTGGGGLPAVVRFVLGPPGAPAPEVLPAAWADPGRREAVDADEVSVSLPRHRLRSSWEVTDRLAALGAGSAVSDAADFSGLSPGRLRIDRVVQECVLAVAEEGVEAAAATAVTMVRAAFRRARHVRHLAFDRPFGVVVLDGEGSVPLFTAWQARLPRDPG
ncbi:hypothetical protein GCM10009716_30360 [Streptomyces sodiiphilus]|uniref:Serpin domain-containing protein n=1 Tax=Streptomyces sodiiphilus TaxID=226217 RepID=A0ABN2PGA0_9ACTN